MPGTFEIVPSFGTGNAGSITATAGELIIENTATIASATETSGIAGDVTFDARTAIVKGVVSSPANAVSFETYRASYGGYARADGGYIPYVSSVSEIRD